MPVSVMGIGHNKWVPVSWWYQILVQIRKRELFFVELLQPGTCVLTSNQSYVKFLSRRQFFEKKCYSAVIWSENTPQRPFSSCSGAFNHISYLHQQMELVWLLGTGQLDEPMCSWRSCEMIQSDSSATQRSLWWDYFLTCPGSRLNLEPLSWVH